jgi:16S rRNA (cytidine1402-2'-O)-methyltransferase
MTAEPTGPDGPQDGQTPPPEIEAGRIEAGLHLVATPIGAARDITLRALDILAGADVLAAEDTRSLRRLLEIHGIRLGGRPLMAYHDHNGPRMRPVILQALAAGRSVAYVSEAGTPLVADPGFTLARAAIAEGFTLRAAPGASAVLAALCVSGLASDRFCFLGFPPAQGGERKRFLAEIARIPATLILYESPKRIHRLLGELCETMGADREAALCRELTKRFEETLRGTLKDISARIAERELRGEIVLVLDRAMASPEFGPAAVDAALTAALAELPLRAAVDAVVAETGLPRRQVYQAALALKDGGGQDEA